MKTESNQNIRCNRGITLIALIITIILLVILAAVTIKAVYEMNIVKIASDAAIGYVTEQNKETNTLDEVAKMIGQITGENLTLLKPTVTLSGTKGNENIYSSDVKVTIKDSLDIVTLAKIEIHYIIEGLNEGREETASGRETVVTVAEEGIYKIKAWIQDGKGNKSEIEEVEFIIDKSKPGEPRISLTGTEGDNEYYIDEKVGVKIEAGSNIISGVSAIKYRVEGVGAKAETTEYADTVNFEIEADGESTIYAKIISNSGVVSEEINKKLKKDSTKPNLASVTYVAHDTASITVRTTAQDTVSGLAKVEYQYSTDGTNYITKSITTYTGTTEVTTNNSYKYTGLNDGIKYWLRIKVTDMAGRTIEGTAITQTTDKASLSATELASKIGAYVNYQPNTATNAAYSTTQDGEERSGYSNQTISRNTSLKWRIMTVNSGKLTLVSETIPTSNLTLKGADGYNNGVKLLNDACNSLYKNTTYGAIGRNLNVDDVNGLMGYSPSVQSEFTPSDKYYPKIFQYERWGSINGSYIGSLGLSQQTSWYSGFEQASTLKGKATAYIYTLSDYKATNTVEHALATGQPNSTGSTTHAIYWLASRCVGIGWRLNFMQFHMDGGTVRFGNLFFSDGGHNDTSLAMRPVVEIDLSKANIGITGSGSSTDPYSITAR